MTAAPMTTAPSALNTKSVLSVKDLNVVFSGFKALKGVNLEVYDGEILTIIGANGAGKSTLLDAIVGKSPVASGHV
ncbi:MAG: ATP-binding cassette domain-containing protein, partial [Phormidesmis sp.]